MPYMQTSTIVYTYSAILMLILAVTMLYVRDHIIDNEEKKDASSYVNKRKGPSVFDSYYQDEDVENYFYFKKDYCDVPYRLLKDWEI